MSATRRFSVAGPWINDGSLPPHWEELVDPETGKSYFVDHALKITSWVDPRDLFMKPEVFEECADGGFALGWERAVDAVHGEYFVDHNTWTTTFKDPRLPPAERLKSPLIAHDLLDESIGPLSARASVSRVMANEQDEMFEKMSEYISQNEGRSARLQNRIDELEGELSRTAQSEMQYDLASSDSAYVKRLEAQLALLTSQSQTKTTTTTDARFRKQQQEIEELRTMLKQPKPSGGNFEDTMESFVAVSSTTEVRTAGRGSNSLSKANVAALDNESRTSTEQVKRRETRSLSPRRRLSRYGSRNSSYRNSESGASDLEYEVMTAEMDRLEEMKRSHQTRIKELRVRSASSSGDKSASNRAKLLAAAGNLGSAVGGVTDSQAALNLARAKANAAAAAAVIDKAKELQEENAKKIKGAAAADKVAHLHRLTRQFAEFMSDKSIDFDGGSWDINDRQKNRGILQGIVDIMQQHDSFGLRINGIQKGETGKSGLRKFTEWYPLEELPEGGAATAQGRVLACKQALSEMGIAAERMVATAEIGEIRQVQFIAIYK